MKTLLPLSELVGQWSPQTLRYYRLWPLLLITPRTGREDPTAADAPQTRVAEHEIEWRSPGGPTPNG